MFNLTTFQYNNNPETPVAVITDKEGNILFDASHVCKILGYANTSDVLKKLDDDEKRFVRKEEQKGYSETLDPLGGFQDKWHVYESGLYKLILRSNKPEAKTFTRFVTHELLPTIRKTGSYTMADAKPDLVAINKTHKASYEIAIREGKSKIEARRQAAQAVREYHGANVYQLLGMEEPRLEKPQPISPQEKILAYMQRKGLKQINARDLCTAKVPGCEKAKDARENLQKLVDSGQAMWAANALMQMINWPNS